MKSMAIMRPTPISAIGGTFEGVARLLTPDPKEAAVTAGGAKTIDIDLGSAQAIDTLFLGYTNDSGAGSLAVTYGAGSYTTTALAAVPVAASNLFAPRRHFVSVLDAPIVARYIRLSATFPAGFSAGAIAVGHAFRPTWGYETGGGRFITDTGSATRLFGGGFGIDEGARVGGWKWTLGDLQNAEVDQLYAIAMDRGTTRTLLVVEDPDQTAGLCERTHWGLFQGLDAYERVDPLNTKWALTVGDWA